MKGRKKTIEWKLPSTRYQGSKRKLIPWIYSNIKDISFESALDIFGGTGVVSYLLKRMGKRVTYNDYLKFNFFIGRALIENDSVILNEEDIEFLLKFDKNECQTFVHNTFSGRYFTDDENIWIDCLIGNIKRLREKYSNYELEYKECMAYYALFQSCLVKRPFNLFHRNNLYLRTKDVARSFGNKTTWDRSIGFLFQRYANELNSLVFPNGKVNKATNEDVFLMTDSRYDLIYIDPPYLNQKRTKTQCDYRRMYHFLEGLANYENWGNLIDYRSSNLHLKDGNNKWTDKNRAITNLEQIFRKFRNSVIVVSYKSPGIPAEEEIVSLLKNYKNNVTVTKRQYSYALNNSNGEPNQNLEMMIIGK